MIPIYEYITADQGGKAITWYEYEDMYQGIQVAFDSFLVLCMQLR